MFDDSFSLLEKTLVSNLSYDSVVSFWNHCDMVSFLTAGHILRYRYKNES